MRSGPFHLCVCFLQGCNIHADASLSYLLVLGLPNEEMGPGIPISNRHEGVVEIIGKMNE